MGINPTVNGSFRPQNAAPLSGTGNTSASSANTVQDGLFASGFQSVDAMPNIPAGKEPDPAIIGQIANGIKSGLTSGPIQKALTDILGENDTQALTSGIQAAITGPLGLASGIAKMLQGAQAIQKGDYAGGLSDLLQGAALVARGSGQIVQLINDTGLASKLQGTGAVLGGLAEMVTGASKFSGDFGKKNATDADKVLGGGYIAAGILNMVNPGIGAFVGIGVTLLDKSGVVGPALQALGKGADAVKGAIANGVKNVSTGLKDGEQALQNAAGVAADSITQTFGSALDGLGGWQPYPNPVTSPGHGGGWPPWPFNGGGGFNW